MTNNSENNKRILKNTLFMYFRMLLVMGVTLYTSRIVLEQLGIDDFGIYSVIGGVIVLFTFFNQALSTSTQRFITLELGKKNGNVNTVFSACFKVHLWMAIIIILISETIGIWFVTNKMIFPSGSMYDVHWTYHFTVITCVLNIVRVPYNSLVLAYEKMSFYAYNSLIEVFLKLGIVYLLKLMPHNKLPFYSFLISVVTLIITIWYIIYCKKQFTSVKLTRNNDNSLIKKIISFSGWTTFGSAANVGYQQGIAVLINIFYGVTINAAVGIANQVNSAVTQFVSGFQQALNPQLIKSEASQDNLRQNSLIHASSKFSFLIMLVIAYPVWCNIDYILSLWLGDYPPQTGIITNLILIGVLIESISGPLWVTIYAHGNIIKYQILISTLLILNIPIAYVIHLLNLPAWYIFVIRIFIFLIALIIRLIYLNKLIGLNIKLFILNVFKPLIIISLIVSCNFIILNTILSYAHNFSEFIFQTLYYSILNICIIFFFGLNLSQRKHIMNLIKSKLHILS